MSLIAPSQSDYVVSAFIEQEIELSFYGFYAATAFMSVALLLHKGLRGSYARTGLFIVTIVMFGLSTGHVYISSTFDIIGFPTLSTDPAGYNPQWLLDRSAKLRTDGMILRRIDYFISDAVVVWRTWCIYYDNVWVRAYLALVLAATGATSIACGVLQGKVNGRVTNFLGTFCLLITNFSTTALCAYKVWYYRRFIKSAYAGRRRKTLVENVLLILVESGMLYCIFWLLFMLGDFGYFADGPLGPAFGLEYFMPHFSGIYVSMIILVVALSKSSSETFFSVVDRDLEHQFPNAGQALEKLEFARAPAKSTIITDPESSLAMTGMRDEGVTSIVDLGRRGSDTTDGEDFPQPNSTKRRAAKKARTDAKPSASDVQAGAGKCLFPALPASVVLHIISYTPVDINEPLDRLELLYALSRTCHNVREITLPMAWELFDVTRTRHVGDWTKYLPDDLEHKSKVLLKLTHIHPLVRTVRVLFTRRRIPEVLGAFAKCLEKLTSVTKLEITHAHTAMTTHLKNAFEGYSFPSIRTVILPAQAHNFLRCCTGARFVTVNDSNHECSKLITAIGAACPAVEEVVDFQLDPGNNLKSLIKGAPNLRSIHLQHPSSKDKIISLRPFRNLEQLGATHYLKDTRTFTVKDPPVPLTVDAVLNIHQDFIGAAREFLEERGGGTIVIDHRLQDGTSSSPNTQVVLPPYWTHTISV